MVLAYLVWGIWEEGSFMYRSKSGKVWGGVGGRICRVLGVRRIRRLSFDLKGRVGK